MFKLILNVIPRWFICTYSLHKKRINLYDVFLISLQSILILRTRKISTFSRNWNKNSCHSTIINGTFTWGNNLYQQIDCSEKTDTPYPLMFIEPVKKEHHRCMYWVFIKFIKLTVYRCYLYVIFIVEIIE